MLVEMSQHHVNALIDLLDLEPIEVNIFRGVNPDEERQRIFGGQVAGQALVAARTVDDDRAVHSLHAYFLRPGDPNVPVLYEVDRIRDGRSFTTRRVAAIQHGRAIFHMSASFHIAEPGFDHLDEMPDVPEPDGLPTRQERLPPPALRTRSGRAHSTSATSRTTRSTDESPPADPTGLVPGERRPPRRAGPAHLPPHVRLGHDPARHDAPPHGSAPPTAR